MQMELLNLIWILHIIYYILDKSKIDWVKIDDIFDKLLRAKEYKIISKDTYDFIVCKLLYRIDINEFNIK